MQYKLNTSAYYIIICSKKYLNHQSLNAMNWEVNYEITLNTKYQRIWQG